MSTPSAPLNLARPLRIVMLGTGPFAVPTFRSLCQAADIDVLLLVTRPDKAHGRSAAPSKGAPSKSVPPNPMRDAAGVLGVAVINPETVNAEEPRRTLAGLSPDLLVVCDYGEILAPETLAVAPLGGINLHASLLPKYRGAAPIAWAIYHGERETGNTVIHMTPRLDAGPIIGQWRTPIEPDETCGTLEARLSEQGANLVRQAIIDLATGSAAPLTQDRALATKAPRLAKAMGEIDWTRTAQQIHDQVRAFQPWPQCYTFWQRPDAPSDREPLRLIVQQTGVVKDAHSASQQAASPGTVIAASDRLIVAAGDSATGGGALEIITIQPSGKKALAALEFLRGYPVKPGEAFLKAESRKPKAESE